MLCISSRLTDGKSLQNNNPFPWGGSIKSAIESNRSVEAVCSLACFGLISYAGQEMARSIVITHGLVGFNIQG